MAGDEIPSLSCGMRKKVIKVYENGNISVKFKFADELRRIVEYIELNTNNGNTAKAV